MVQMIEQSERHGFDYWQQFGALEQCAIDARVLLASTDRDPAALSAHITTMTAIRDTSSHRRRGLPPDQRCSDWAAAHRRRAARPDPWPTRRCTGHYGRQWPKSSTTPNCCGCVPTPSTTPTRAQPGLALPSTLPAARTHRLDFAALDGFKLGGHPHARRLQGSTPPAGWSVTGACRDLARARELLRE